jgi:Hydrogenase maturation factor
VIDESRFVNLVNPKIMKAMEEMKADVFGLSIDSILIFTDDPDAVIGTLVKENIRSDVIGEVTEWRGYPILTYSGKEMRPSFRETPYTPVKAVIGNSTPYTLGEIETRLNEALEASLKKKEWVLKNLKVTNR